jgi:signal transduction histidine kinase
MTMLNLFEFRFYGISYIAASIISVTVGLVVLTNNFHKAGNRSFFLMTVTGFLWLANYGLFIQAKNIAIARLFLKISYLISIPYISPSVYLFSVLLSNKIPNRIYIRIAFVSAFILSLATSTNSDLIWKISKMPWGNSDVLLKTKTSWFLFLLLTTHFLIYALVAFVNLADGVRTAKSPHQRTQRRLFLIGFIIGYIGSLDFGITLGFNIIHVGPYAFSLFCLIIAYAILRHQFLNVKLVLKKLSVVFLIYTFIALLVIPLSIVFLEHFSGQPHFNPIQVMLYLGLLIGGTLSMGPFIYAFVVRNSVWLKGSLATGLTHELKSPLGVLQSTVEVLRDELTSAKIDPQKATDYLDMAQSNLERLEITVRGLLNIAQIQDQDFSANKTLIDLALLAKRILEDYRATAQKKGITLSFEGPESLTIIADKEKIEQSISNILSNALKFSERGAVRIAISKNEGEINFSVCDEGPGIGRKEITRIFDRFYQAKPNQKGTGIGLTIAKAWVESHGGKIWAESEGEGKGTTVRFTIPIT